MKWINENENWLIRNPNNKHVIYALVSKTKDDQWFAEHTPYMGEWKIFKELDKAKQWCESFLGYQEKKTKKMKINNIKILIIMLGLITLTGCVMPLAYAVKDTVYGDYWTGQDWSKDASKAEIFTRQSAQAFVDQHRQNELGEYANNGPLKYPIKVVQYPKP